ncbi:MAG TPA: DUF4215 domain-containing protein [Kofleriaceae bacterium]
MRTCALIVVLAATFVAGCGDSTMPATTMADICSNGAAVEGDSCGAGMICRSSRCVASACGDGIVAAGEECDDGNKVDGDGCDSNCKFTCLTSDPSRNCTSADACAGKGVCGDAHVCIAGTPLADGHACGNGGSNVCHAGVCMPPHCGDGEVDPGEQCDGGPGCKANCTFLCTNDPATQCGGTAAACEKFACKADHSCELVADLAANFQQCDQNPANVCILGTCKAAPVCGNGIVEFGEDCDDGNFRSNDGCDRCSFEQAARITSLVQQFGTDAFCTKNALGTAISRLQAAQDFIQQTWSFPVGDGTISLVFKFMGTIDPSGARSTFNLGFFDATPVRFNQQDDGTFADNYNGTNDLDWWYTLRQQDPNNPFDTPNLSLDANGTPRVQLPAEIFDRHLTAGPGTIENIRLLFALAPANVALFNVHIDATLDTKLSKPTVSTTNTPPGHLASEHLSPDFITFESSGISSALGGMCSDVSAKSLANALPGLLGLCADPADATGGTPAFQVDNHLLDVFIFGCQLFTTDPTTGKPGFVPTIAPTQPDGSLDGSTYTFALDPATHKVTSCTKDGNDAVLDVCLANALFSSYFKIAADRVILRTDKPSVLPPP